MSYKSRVLLPVLSLACFFAISPMAWADSSPSSTVTAESSSAETTIQTLDQAILSTMQAGEKAGYQGRYKIIAPVLNKTFDFRGIAQIALGSDWPKLSAAQQKQFVSVLAEYTAATYAGRFDSYNGEHLAVIQTQQLRPGTMGVFTTLTLKNGRVHRFDYLLTQDKGAGWRVINVVADGVSDLSMKRSEYTQMIKNKGFSALIAHLQQQIKDYATGKKS